MTSWSAVTFLVGWICGWVLLCRPRRLPAPLADRASIAVVIPARDEAVSIGATVAAVVRQRRPGDEIVVVDDHSTDGTADLARAAGATVIEAPPLPTGWAGKPHAVHAGVVSTTAPLLAFVDADVTVAPDALDRWAAAVERFPDRLVSEQPWHRTERWWEQASLVFNVVAVMGSAFATIAGDRVATRVAFGPVMVCRRDRYVEVGGHAHPSVRSAILEDIALARRFGRSALHLGSAHGTTFRMYPAGLRQVVEGWTKGAGIGADATPWWVLFLAIAWVWSLAGGWLTSPWFASASIVQLAVLARLVGRFRWWAIVLFPVPLVAFVVIFLRSVVRRMRRRNVTWKGRSLVPDQSTD
jgi:4,4'-diaponeurosporenoate glycosyltransferase